MEDFKQKFVVEAHEHITDLEQVLLELEHSPQDKQLIERVFRSMHSLKGGGAMFGFDIISHFTHDLESLYDLVRQDKMVLSDALFDVTLRSVDHLKNLLDKGNNLTGESLATHQSLLMAIEKISNKGKTEQIRNIQSPQNASVSTFLIHFTPNETIFNDGTNPYYLLDDLYGLGNIVVYAVIDRIPNFEDINPERCYIEWIILLATAHSLDAIKDVFIFTETNSFLHIEQISNSDLLQNSSFLESIEEHFKNKKKIELDTVKTISHQKGLNIVQQTETQTHGTSHKSGTLNSIRVSTDKLDTLMNLVSELVTTQARLSLFTEKMGNSELSSISENMQKLTRELRDNAFSIVLVPIDSLVVRFQRLVRDLSIELKKEVHFEVSGAETELDKTIIESITDPLMHIFRNSLDHGLETPDQRQAAGKPRQGTITLNAFHTGPQVCIQIKDDGKGIDTKKIKKKAIDNGLITADQQLSDKEILDLIFISGFSTADKVTDISGRGVGMDIVKKKLAQVRGEVEIETELHKGTTVTIKLPLTLSIIDGLLVKVDKTFFIIPLTSVAKIYGIEHTAIENTFNNHITLDDNYYPFVYLRKLFDIQTSAPVQEELMLVSYQDKQVGLVIDTVVGEYQAVLKPLGKHYKHQEILSGASILGDGTVALVVDTNKLVKSFAHHTITEEQVYGN